MSRLILFFFFLLLVWLLNENVFVTVYALSVRIFVSNFCLTTWMYFDDFVLNDNNPGACIPTLDLALCFSIPSSSYRKQPLDTVCHIDPSLLAGPGSFTRDISAFPPSAPFYSSSPQLSFISQPLHLAWTLPLDISHKSIVL